MPLRNCLKRRAVIRISLPYVYGLAEALEPLDDSLREAKKFGDIVTKLWAASRALDTLTQDSPFAASLRSSQELAEKLKEKIAEFEAEHKWSDTLEFKDTISVYSAFKEYKVALLAEIGVFPSYYVTQKSGYDMLTLLDNGEMIFPASLVAKLPDALFDAREAARALAFEMPTACGFHIFRATETVLRKYYDEITGTKSKIKTRSIGVYLNSMKQKGVGDDNIVSALKQMTELHRNPIIHPETVLIVDEAISILGIAQSAISAMLAALPTPLPTTAAPGAAS